MKSLRWPIALWFFVFIFAAETKNEQPDFLAGYLMAGFIIIIAAIFTVPEKNDEKENIPD